VAPSFRFRNSQLAPDSVGTAIRLLASTFRKRLVCKPLPLLRRPGPLPNRLLLSSEMPEVNCFTFNPALF
jgi:hypothetical protein